MPVRKTAQRPAARFVIGAGPCGYFAALLLAQMGFRPLLAGACKPVKERSADTFGFCKERPSRPRIQRCSSARVEPGTFSDGKLYQPGADPQHHGRQGACEELVACGANPDKSFSLHRPTSAPSKLAHRGAGLALRIEKPWVAKIRFQCKVEQLETVMGDPTRAPNRSSACGWGAPG